jgi:hypothetical protein
MASPIDVAAIDSSLMGGPCNECVQTRDGDLEKNLEPLPRRANGTRQAFAVPDSGGVADSLEERRGAGWSRAHLVLGRRWQAQTSHAGERRMPKERAST